MDNILISIGSINIYWYSFLILVSVIIGLVFSMKEAKRIGLGQNFIADLSLPLVIFSIIGARLYYVIFNFSYYKDNILEIFKIWEGGLAIYGAIIGGFFAIIFEAKKRGKSVIQTTDLFAPYLILGQAIGRWGNFFNQEAYGQITSFENLQNLHIPNFIIQNMYINGNYYQPTFLYESLWCFLGFIILILIRKIYKTQNIGTLTGIYCIFYSVGRFFIEIYRSDSLFIGSYKVSMIMSIIIFIVGIFLLITSKNRGKYSKSEEIYVNL